MKRAVPVGTLADTPESLRRKAREFERLTGETRDPARREELLWLAERYSARASQIEGSMDRDPPESPAGAEPSSSETRSDHPSR
jgi:hypothetical protein